jgi:uncharacterized protein
MTRARSGGAAFAPVYRRRLLVLLLIGLAHAVLLWPGDILVLYALLGFPLLLFRERGPRTVLVWAAISLVVPLLLLAGVFGLLEAGRATPEVGAEIERQLAQARTEFHALTEQAIQVYRHGSFAEITAQRIQDLLFFYSGILFFAPHVFGMFLLGLYAGRRGLFHDLSAHRPFFTRVLRWGLVLGLVGSAAYTLGMEAADRVEPTGPLLLAVAGLTVGGPALSLAYAAGLTLLVQRAAWRRLLAPLAAAGRMALSNYLLQSLIATTIFYGYGLGLYGQTGPVQHLGLAVAIFFLVQLPLSAVWVRRFRFGPAEWLWRSLTYGRRQPIRG